MDSRLLNVVYDDPFDGNYSKYDNDTDLWSSGSETMGMQLTETLHGILPIAPSEDFRSGGGGVTTGETNKNAFNYGDFAGHHLTGGGSIEILTVDPNADGYDTDSEDEDSDDDDDRNHVKSLDFDQQSQYSFRTRTDSSSIGDYESHTSDYDDDDDDDDDDVANDANCVNKTNSNSLNQSKDILMNVITSDDFAGLDSSYHKRRTLSTNTIGSDADALGFNIDANNFDLADFITKDDFTINIPAEQTIMPPGNSQIFLMPNTSTSKSDIVQLLSSKQTDSDSDSDVIVDIETVDADEETQPASDLLKPLAAKSFALTTHQSTEQQDLSYVDNVQSDPSWTPMQTTKRNETKVEEKSLNQKVGRGLNLVPNKKQCDLLKGKFSKAKNIKPKGKTSKLTSKCLPPNTAVKKVGVGMGGKNLSLIKHKSVSISEQSSEETPTKDIGNPRARILQQQLPTYLTIGNLDDEELEQTPAQKAAVKAVKRKLNLEEYKQRRGGEPMQHTRNQPQQQQFNSAKVETYKIPKLEINSAAKAPTNLTPTKHSEAVTSIVKSLKQQQNQMGGVRIPADPITEAKNKVLRMQEMKKAQQMRIIDSTISAKVPRVTKMLPLREIVKDTPYLNEEERLKLKSAEHLSLKTLPDYEEIVIVSASCNTDISLPPVPNENTMPVNNASRSLLKSSALLSTISHTFKKVKDSETVKISPSSLLTSIQDVVVKKALPHAIEDCPAVGGTTNVAVSKPEEHGENKIIMHLRKDRLRKQTSTIGTQTELQPEFPPLPLPKSYLNQRMSRERARRRKRQYRKRNSAGASSSSEYSSDEKSDKSRSSSVSSRSRENSYSSSTERMRTYDSAIGTGGYSSRSSRRHRSSISSSYSESHHGRVTRGRRQRRTSFKQRSSSSRRKHADSTRSSSSSSYTSDSDRSRSPHHHYRRSRSRSTSRSRNRRTSYNRSNNNSFVDRNVSQPAVEERRIVYVGRIEQETTKDMLRRKFLPYGTIKQISIHYKDTGMKYGFVTFERPQDAFTAIDNSTRDPQINMYDVSFGGRRAFCRASYADLDNAGINTYQSYVFPQAAPQKKEDDSFEALLMKMKAKLTANKGPANAPASNTSSSTANSSI